MAQIYTIGETVYDIIFKNDQPVTARAGGAMLNTSISLGRLGLPVSFISEIGEDDVGNRIISFLKSNDVDIKNIYRFKVGKTAIALAFLDENENANYSFYKTYPGIRLDIDFPKIKKEDIVLFGSFFSITKAVRLPLIKFIQSAKKAGAIIIYDPNFRKPHLKELPEVKKNILENISYADIIRGSDEDFKLIFKSNSANDAYGLINSGDNKILIYTKAEKGVDFLSPNYSFSIPTEKINSSSTIGAGDSFNAGLIYSLTKNNITRDKIPGVKLESWEQIVKTGISFGSEVCKIYDNYISRSFAKRLL